jgi:hypothetical protein
VAITLPASNSLDQALKAAQPGDTITIAPGTYPSQTITFDAAKEGASERVVVEGAGASIGNLDVNGTQHLEVRGLTIGGLWNIRPSTGNSNRPTSKVAHDLLFTNMTVKTFLFRNVSDVVVRGGTIGGWDASVTPLGPPKVGAYAAQDGAPERLSTNVLVEDCLFQDMLRTVVGSAHAEGFYLDAGVDGLTLRGCTFTNCAVFDIFSNGQAAGRPITNILIENNLLDIPRGVTGATEPSAIDFKGGAGKVTLRGNSILGNIRKDTATYSEWVSEKNAIGGVGGSSADVMAPDPGFVSARRDPCDLNACYRNDLHVKPDSAAGLAGAGVPVSVPPPPPPDPDTLPLTVIAETDTRVTLGWTPVPGAIGFRFTKDGKVVSHTWDPARAQVVFAKDGVLGVETLLPGPSGDWPN